MWPQIPVLYISIHQAADPQQLLVPGVEIALQKLVCLYGGSRVSGTRHAAY